MAQYEAPSQKSTGQKRYRLGPRSADVAALADLWVDAWQAVMPQIDFASRRSWLIRCVADIEAQGGTTICAYDTKGDVTGFFLLDLSRTYLEQIAIAPEQFGSGLARLLIGEAQRLCPDGLTLDVNADNLRALRFYEKAGFQRGEPGINPASGLATWRMHWPSPV
ncbi:MAG: GNAT family N-acetyltransferase [Methylovirgula sp.]